MSKIRLHLDADTSSKKLHAQLIANGHDVTRTPTDWIDRDASDEEQLLQATQRKRCIFTFNARDFIPLAQKYPQHWGIIIAAQSKWNLAQLIKALDLLLSEKQAEDLKEQVLWLKK